MIVALAVVVAIVGAGLLVRAAVGPRAPRRPRRDVPSRQPSPPPVKPLVAIVRDADDRPVAGATVVAGQFKRQAESPDRDHRVRTAASS